MEPIGNFLGKYDENISKEIDGKYITIYHGLGIKFNLSTIENAIVSIILKLSKNSGWCYLGKKKFALYLNTNEQTIRDRISDLKKWGYVEENSTRSHLKTSMLRVSSEIKECYRYHKKLADQGRLKIL